MRFCSEPTAAFGGDSPQQVVDQPIGRHHLARVQRKQREQRTSLLSAQLHRLPLTSTSMGPSSRISTARIHRLNTFALTVQSRVSARERRVRAV